MDRITRPLVGERRRSTPRRRRLVAATLMCWAGAYLSAYAALVLAVASLLAPTGDAALVALACAAALALAGGLLAGARVAVRRLERRPLRRSTLRIG